MCWLRVPAPRMTTTAVAHAHTTRLPIGRRRTISYRVRVEQKLEPADPPLRCLDVPGSDLHAPLLLRGVKASDKKDTNLQAPQSLWRTEAQAFIFEQPSPFIRLESGELL